MVHLTYLMVSGQMFPLDVGPARPGPSGQAPARQGVWPSPVPSRNFKLHRCIFQLLRDKRELISNFVEEALRLEGPIKGDFRLARVSTKLSGVDIPAGTTVMVLNGVAGRDPRQFECPGEFRVDRPNARHHLAFGHGIHTCPGAPLARSEGRVSIERLLDRTANIEISEAAHGPAGARRFEYLPTSMFRGLSRLHLEFTPIG